MKKNKFFLLIVFVLAFSVIPTYVSAEGKELVKKSEYTTRSKQDKRHNFKEEIKENGKKYHLEKVTYQIKKEVPVTTREPVAVTVTKKVRKGTYKPQDSVVKEGVKCELQDTTEKEMVIKKAYTRTVSGYSVYESEKEARNAPSTKKITAKDKKTGKTVTVLCEKQGIKKLNASSWQNTHIDITFISYDADTFRWGGITVKKSETQPLKGYEDQLLKSVGANTKNYKVKSISWNGKAYRNADGILCRKAVASVSKKVPHYRVTYQATQRVPAEKGIMYTSTYAGLKETVTGETDYIMLTTGHYTEVKSKSIPVVAITVGTVLVVIMLVGILWIVRKKQRGTENQDKHELYSN